MTDPGAPDDLPEDRPAGYDGARRRAERLAKDPEETERLLARARSKAERVRDVERVRGVWDDLTSLFRLVRARVRGEYQQLPWRSLVSALAAIVYFVSPLDVIPDFIPILGFVDDVAVLAFVMRMIAGDVADFRVWEATRDDATETQGGNGT